MSLHIIPSTLISFLFPPFRFTSLSIPHNLLPFTISLQSSPSLPPSNTLNFHSPLILPLDLCQCTLQFSAVRVQKQLSPLIIQQSYYATQGRQRKGDNCWNEQVCCTNRIVCSYSTFMEDVLLYSITLQSDSCTVRWRLYIIFGLF